MTTFYLVHPPSGSAFFLGEYGEKWRTNGMPTSYDDVWWYFSQAVGDPDYRTSLGRWVNEVTSAVWRFIMSYTPCRCVFDIEFESELSYQVIEDIRRFR